MEAFDVSLLKEVTLLDYRAYLAMPKKRKHIAVMMQYTPNETPATRGIYQLAEKSTAKTWQVSRMGGRLSIGPSRNEERVPNALPSAAMSPNCTSNGTKWSLLVFHLRWCV